MQKTIDLFVEQLIGIHSDTLSIGLVETVKVDYHGQLTPIKYIGSVAQKGRRISVNPYDPGAADLIEQTLKKCGFSAYKFSKQEVVVNVPSQSGEESEKTFTRIKKLGEETKVAIRNVRKKLRQRLTDDEKKAQTKTIDEQTHLAVKEIDQIVSDKIKSLRIKN